MDAIAPELLAKLKSAQHVAVLTGAGVSAESGVPTFRDAQTGLWAKFRPEDLATPEAFRRNPKMVWEWYQYRFNAVSAVEPNPGHHALAVLQDMFPQFTLITQNVDGLHERAGSRKVIELHGNILKHKCLDCGIPLSLDDAPPGSPPSCPCEKSYYRPDVVWFGENSLDRRSGRGADGGGKSCDVFLCALRHLHRGLSRRPNSPCCAQRRGAVVVEINPDETPLTGQAWTLCCAGPAALVLPGLVDALRAPG